MINSVVEQRFKEFPLFYQEFLTSGFARQAATVFGSSLQLSNDQIPILEDGIILYLLYILDKKDLVEYLVENVSSNPTDTTAIIETILSCLPDFAKRDDLAVTSDNSSSGALATEIAETEREFDSLQGIRTMAGDLSIQSGRNTQPRHTKSSDVRWRYYSLGYRTLVWG
jgi:hypothetical protein